MLPKHVEMDGEVRVMKGRGAIGSLARIMEGRNVSVEVEGGLRNSILKSTLTYGLKTWT